jgi:uncharacterized membrane protein
MTRWLIAYAAAGLAFLVLDIIWLGFVAPRVYRPALGSLLAERINIAAAGAFYVIYVGGIVVLAVSPAIAAKSFATGTIMGAILGLTAYGTYNLTNLATLRDWPPRLAIVDMAWGTFATSAASAAAYLVVARAIAH